VGKNPDSRRTDKKTLVPLSHDKGGEKGGGLHEISIRGRVENITNEYDKG